MFKSIKDLIGTLSICLFLFLSFSFSAFAAVSTDNLEGYWKFDETSGTDTNDWSGHNNDGVRTNGSISTDVPTTNFSNTRSIDFDGDGDYIDMGDATSLEVESGSFSISLWFNPNSSPVDDAEGFALVSKGTPASEGYALQYEQVGGNFTINVSKYGVTDQRVDISELTNGTWYHLVAVQRSNEIEYYIDGSSVGTYTNNSSYNSSGSNTFRIGKATGVLELETDGLIDDVRVYSRELAESEITDLSNGNHTEATWDGSSSSNPETAANWNINAVPDRYTRLVIPDVTNQPVATVDLAATGITINSGAWFDLASYDLTITNGGTFSNEGTLRLDNTQSVLGFTNDTDSGAVLITPTSNTTELVLGDSYYDLIINDSLVGYWKFDESSSGGSDSVADRSGYQNNGTPSGSSGGNNKPQPSSATPDESFVNPYSLDFDGTDDVVTVDDENDIFDLDSTFTLSAWTYVDTHDAGYSFLISRDDTGGSSYDLGFKAGKPYVAINDGEWGEYVTDDVLATGAWYHVAGVRSSDDTLRIYINGVEQKEFTGVKNPQASLTDVTFGKRSTSAYEHDGRIDDVRIYNTDLSDAEVLAMGTGSHPAHAGYSVGLDAALDINGDLVINSGTLDANSNTITVAGDFENNGGVFTADSGAVTLNGTGQSINSSNNFYNLTKSVSSADTLTFGQNSTTTITGTLTLNGVSDNLLSLRSAIDGTAFKIDPSGTRSISYVNVQDSNNIDETEIVYSGTNIYGSNLTNWTIFGTTTISSCSDWEDLPSSPNGDVLLASDLDCGSGMQQISLSNITLDGDKYTINVAGDSALLNTVSSSTIQDLRLTGNLDLDGDTYESALAKNVSNGSVIQRVGSSVEITNAGVYNGGLVGTMNNSSIVDSYVSGDIASSEGDNYIGGIVGIMANDSLIERSYMSGSVTSSNARIGGILGLMDGTGDTADSIIRDSFVVGEVAGHSTLSAAVVGLVGAEITPTDVLINNYYDETRTDRGLCAIASSNVDDESGVCEAVNTEASPDSNYFINNIINPPLDEWNFSTVWFENSEYPLLDDTEEPETPEVDESSNSGGGGGLSLYEKIDRKIDRGDIEGAKELILKEILDEAEDINPNFNKIMRLLGIYLELDPLPTEEVNEDINNSDVEYFPYNLRSGMTDSYVKDLQKFLNDQGFILSDIGNGSPGNETEYFGPRTYDALIRFQEANSEEILEPLNLENGTGFFGESTRNFVNQMI